MSKHIAIRIALVLNVAWAIVECSSNTTSEVNSTSLPEAWAGPGHIEPEKSNSEPESDTDPSILDGIATSSSPTASEKNHGNSQKFVLGAHSSWNTYKNTSLKCVDLHVGQYYCADPAIDPETQQAVSCTYPESADPPHVQVECFPIRGIWCIDQSGNGKEHTGESVGFNTTVPCKWTNGKRFSTALLLSVFFGVLGVDRFYLGYPAIGLLKLCTLGFMLLGHLVDILLIALQVVGPSDGSNYVIDYYGAGLDRIDLQNDTYFKPQMGSL